MRGRLRLARMAAAIALGAALGRALACAPPPPPIPDDVPTYTDCVRDATLEGCHVWLSP